MKSISKRRRIVRLRRDDDLVVTMLRAVFPEFRIERLRTVVSKGPTYAVHFTGGRKVVFSPTGQFVACGTVTGRAADSAQASVRLALERRLAQYNELRAGRKRGDDPFKTKVKKRSQREPAGWPVEPSSPMWRFPRADGEDGWRVVHMGD